MATVGYGDLSLATAPDWLKLYDVGLMAISAVLLAAMLAFAADLLLSARIDRALGRFPRPRQDHVIVCGLGKAGSRVLQRLHDLDIPCVGIESSQNAVGVPVADGSRSPSCSPTPDPRARSTASTSSKRARSWR